MDNVSDCYRSWFSKHGPKRTKEKLIERNCFERNAFFIEYDSIAWRGGLYIKRKYLSNIHLAQD